MTPSTDEGVARRQAIVAGIAGAVVAIAISASAALGRAPLVGVVVAVQLAAAVVWLVLLDAPAGAASLLVTVGAIAGSDITALRRGGTALGGTVGVLAGCVLAALVVELARRQRSRVTESLAATLSAVLVVTALAQLLALAGGRGGRHTVEVVAVVAAVTFLAGRAGDALTPRPVLAPGATRGLTGAVSAFVVGTGLGAALGASLSPLTTRSGAALGAVVALAVCAADLAVDLSLADLVDPRRLAMGRPAAALLPFVAASPVAYATARVLVG